MIALTTVDIHLDTITIPCDSVIYIDTVEHVALWNGIHFFIELGEFAVLC